VNRAEHDDIRNVLSTWTNIQVPAERRMRVVKNLRLEADKMTVKHVRTKLRTSSWWSACAAVAGCMVFAGMLILDPHLLNKWHQTKLTQWSTNINHHPSTNSIFTEQEAIINARNALGLDIFPTSPSSTQGVIWEGGPYPGRQIPAELQTQVDMVSTNTYVVTFTESWAAKNFMEQHSDPSHQILNHYWKYEVTSNRTVLIANGGDFAPQDVK
jgi:hypothetical protein